MRFSGLNVSEGYGIGVVRKINNLLELDEISMQSVEKEQVRFRESVESVKDDLKVLVEKGGDGAEIIEAHILMLEDPELGSKVNGFINEKFTAEFSAKKAAGEIMDVFLSLEDEYLRQRASDVKDVSDRVIYKLIGKSNDLTLTEDTIVVAEDLLPSQTASIDKTYFKGIITEAGGRTSHTSILANIMGIPAISNVKVEDIVDGSNVIIDGFTGDIILDPNDKQINEYKSKQVQYLKEKKILEAYRSKEVILSSGVKIDTFINIGSVDDMDHFESSGANGVGLFRTEFLYMAEQTAPSEDLQFKVYKEVLERAKGNTVIIRTLDIGGDKDVSYLDFPKEDNPFLGYRAVRYCLDHKCLFKTQIKAILRASNFGDAWMMVPMISTVNEIVETKKLVEICKDELRASGQLYGEIKIGIMIETPAAAIKADILAKHVDFFSIGTNDLTQYTMAADRMNDKVKSVYDYFDPAVIRLIKVTIDAALENDIEIGMCGEAAGDPYFAPLLLALGLKEFSVSPNKLLGLKKLMIQCDVDKIRENLDEILSIDSADDIRAFMKALI